jgi:predicted transposase/invertase (TIGR01784 family)
VRPIRTTIAKNIHATDEKTNYDAACKRLLSEKIILAKADYDLMTAVMICLGKEEESGTDVLKLLNVLLSTETDSKDKCQILEEDFHIKMTQSLESEVSLMCNLSKGVEEKGIQKGIQEGIQKGIAAMVLTLKELQISRDVILNQICEKFGLTEEAAEVYLKEIG